MQEKYTFEKAQDEAYKVRDKAFELKAGREEKGEPSGEDYAKAEQSLEDDKKNQEKLDNKKLEDLRTGFSGEKENINSENNYQENTGRFQVEIGKYLENGAASRVPEFYQQEYKMILQKHFEELQKNPISPNCKFSLVLPAYREEKVILQTLESLENQTGINPDEFEVLVVANYPKGKKPEMNEYNDQGTKMGSHPDRTKEIVEDFGKKSKIRFMVIEQDFPEHYTNEKGEQKKFAGVGIASKLGMDLALMRQKNNPQVIGYYGADSVFDPNWIKDCLDTYKKDKVDSVRGRQKENKHYNKVEDENGLHTLEEDVIEKIWTFEKRRYKYLHQLKIAINNEAVANGKDKKKEAHGAATQTAGMYAHIGGMNIEAGGEDIKNAQTISEAGRIVDSDEGKMCAVAVGRIENPRTEGGSYTQGLWTMYRAFQYGEGNLLDKEGNLLVDDPEDFRDREIALNNSLKSIEKFYHEGKIDETIERYFSSEEIVVLQEAKIKNPDNFDQFLNSITASLKESFWKKFYELHPLKRIRIEDAEKKFGEMQ